MIDISQNFDSGNIIVKDARKADNIRLEIRRDHRSDFYQWFHFRVTGAAGTECHFHIENSAGAAYPDGWKDYRAVASTDRKNWIRVPTILRNGVLSITHTPPSDCIYYAYFAPYSMERHGDLLARFASQPDVILRSIGTTLDGQSMDVLTVAGGGDHTQKRQIWITARQHPGETMASWWVEGFLTRLTDSADPVARALRQKATLHIVPNMNPDGSRRGHLRTNAAGINLNREWSKPSLDKSPEVFHVLGAMHITGIDLALDVHGDEALPYNFIAGTEGIPGFTPDQETLLEGYKSALKTASPDFQTRYGYPRNPPGTANMGICANALAGRFQCLAMTLEMPFKDTVETPDQIYGWSPERCKRLGAANLDAMLDIMSRGHVLRTASAPV